MIASIGDSQRKTIYQLIQRNIELEEILEELTEASENGNNKLGHPDHNE